MRREQDQSPFRIVEDEGRPLLECVTAEKDDRVAAREVTDRRLHDYLGESTFALPNRACFPWTTAIFISPPVPDAVKCV